MDKIRKIKKGGLIRRHRQRLFIKAMIFTFIYIAMLVSGYFLAAFINGIVHLF